MLVILIDICSCKKKEILKIKKKYFKLKKIILYRFFRNIFCGLDVFYDIKMKVIYKLKKIYIILILIKKVDSKIFKGNILL